MKNSQTSMKEINLLFTKECKRRGIIKKTLLKNFMIDFINENYQEKSINKTKENNSEEIVLSFSQKRQLFSKVMKTEDLKGLSKEEIDKLLKD